VGADAYVTVLIKTITVKFLGDKEPFFSDGKMEGSRETEEDNA